MNQDYYINLIYKQLQGDLSTKEAHSLRDWLAESAEHQQLKESIKIASDMLDDFEPSFEIDPQADYRKLRQQMQAIDQAKEAAPKAKSVSLFSKRRVLSIAASIVFMLGAAWLFNYSQAPALEMMLAQTQAGEIKQIQLADQTSVWLNENSRLEYPKQFSRRERAVILMGEAFFEVARDASKPFKVSTEQAMVEVLGTSFNVRALQEEAHTSVAVETGKVRFSAKAAAKEVILVKEESASLSHDKTQFEKNITNDHNASAWKTKQLGFRSQHLEKVFEIMERYFGINIELKNPELKECTFTMPSQKIGLDQIWEILQVLYQIEVDKKDEKTYWVSGGRCD